MTLVGGAGQAGTSSAVINLAAALARQGKDVLVIDEHCDAKSLIRKRIGAGFERTLADVAAGVPLESVAALHDERVRVIAAPVGSSTGIALASLLATLDEGFDIVLIDAKLDANGALSPLALQAQGRGRRDARERAVDHRRLCVREALAFRACDPTSSAC